MTRRLGDWRLENWGLEIRVAVGSLGDWPGLCYAEVRIEALRSKVRSQVRCTVSIDERFGNDEETPVHGFAGGWGALSRVGGSRESGRERRPCPVCGSWGTGAAGTGADRGGGTAGRATV